MNLVWFAGNATSERLWSRYRGEHSREVADDADTWYGARSVLVADDGAWLYFELQVVSPDCGSISVIAFVRQQKLCGLIRQPMQRLSQLLKHGLITSRARTTGMHTRERTTIRITNGRRL